MMTIVNARQTAFQGVNNSKAGYLEETILWTRWSRNSVAFLSGGICLNLYMGNDKFACNFL